MESFFGKNSLLIRNCIILYLLVAGLASLLADFHHNYQESLQADNADKFYRIMSLGVAYQAKEMFNSK
jgi:hypothetical protein